MVNYNNGKIYKIEPICEHEENEIYIGSITKQYLSQRMDEHRRKYNSWKEGKANYVTSFSIFDKYGVVNCGIVLLESVNVDSKDELHAREKHYIKTLKCVNKFIPNRSIKEYYIDNKEVLCEKARIYRDQNDIKIVQYRIEHKEETKETNKKYHNEHRESLLLKMKERGKIKNDCICGSIYRKSDKSAHDKCKKHQNYIANNPIELEIPIDV